MLILTELQIQRNLGILSTVVASYDDSILWKLHIALTAT